MATATSIQNMQNPSIVLYGAKDAKIEDKPISQDLGPHDVLIRIAYVGVCGSDVHFWNHGGIGKPINPTTGITMGHEASGTIIRIGSSVSTVHINDTVALEPGIPCRRCTHCKSGTYNLCRKMRFAAAPGPPDTQGTLCKYYVLPEDFVYPLPAGLGLDEAVLVEPLAVGVHAIKLANVRPGQTVVVMGSGTVGLMCAAVAKQFGALRIIIVDLFEKKLEFARGWLGGDDGGGVETYLFQRDESGEVNARKLLDKFGLAEDGTDTFGGKIDTVIEASGAAGSIETGIHILRPGGTFIQVGLGKPKVEFPIVAMGQKELMVRGCFRYGAGDYELAVKYLTTGKINVKSLISSVTRFEHATQAWDKTANGEGIKNLIQGVQD